MSLPLHLRSSSSSLGSSKSSSSGGVSLVSEEVMPEMDLDLVPVPGVANTSSLSGEGFAPAGVLAPTKSRGRPGETPIVFAGVFSKTLGRCWYSDEYCGFCCARESVFFPSGDLCG